MRVQLDLGVPARPPAVEEIGLLSGQAALDLASRRAHEREPRPEDVAAAPARQCGPGTHLRFGQALDEGALTPVH